MSTLDCETPKGQQAIAEQNAIIATVATRLGRRAVPPKSLTCPWDVKFEDPLTGRVTSIAEVKSRDATFRQLTVLWERGPHPGYLITAKKIFDGQEESARLGVPYLVVVGLMPEYRIVYWRVTDEEGRFLWRDEIEIAKTPTKTSVNNPSKIRRPNAYLPVARMLELPNATWWPVRDGSRAASQLSRLCLGCGTLLHQTLVAEGADYHLLCRPRRRHLRVARVTLRP